MSVELLERAVMALGPLAREVVFVGGATVSLWITDPAAPAPRPTKDVDVVLEVVTRRELHAFDERLRERGFREDIESDVICRWRHAGATGEEALILDAMPARAGLLGFANRWQAAAIPHALERTLPSGATLRAAAPAHLIATKLEAFRSRGRGDHLGSRDLEDIVLLVDGREEIVDDVAQAPEDVRGHLATELGELLESVRFIDAVFGFLRPDASNQSRADAIVLPRLQALAGR